MKTLKIFGITFLVLSIISCSKQNKKNLADETKNKVNNYLAKSMKSNDIPGLALAVIKDDKVIYENYLGKASLEENSPVNDKTIFRVFSTTKLITTTAVFQLIEKGKLSLEDSISKHLDGLPLEWQKVKIKNLLSHSSGIPDIIRYESTLTDKELMNKLREDKMQFPTGQQHVYNQTNYWLLAQIIEKLSGNSFDEFALNNQFGGAKDGVLFSSNSLATIPNRATRYYYSSKENKHVKHTRNDGVRGHSGNGLNISLNKFIEWDKKLKNNTLLSEATKAKMWSAFQFTNNFDYQKDNFLHGWGHYYVNNLDSYGFTGGNISAYRYFPKNNTTIILLSNSNQTPAHDIIVNDIARMVIPTLKDKNLAFEADAMNFLLDGKLDEAEYLLKKLKAENPNSKFDNLKFNINGLGNSYAWNNEPKKALKVFQLSTNVYPNWWIGFAGVAEIYELQKDSLNAVKNYKRALLLNEKNEYEYNEALKNKISSLQK